MSALVVENVSKRYVIGHQPAPDTLRDLLSHGLKGLWSRLRHTGLPRASREDFWALRDVSFEVNAGEVIGVIGRNGAGKSTLLKILSRITEPTTGRVRFRGRVASLLEVGTGFHPELTGRENIFLNGAILGMTRVEIRRKFDEIVAFAEVERFLDTPVKRYSSGMYVRLAFAVAAHLEPDILIIDEVLAVGDAQFQVKCLGKMEDAASHGRTVIFVSHDLDNVMRLCRHGLLLREGRVVSRGAISAVVSQYLTSDVLHDGFTQLESRVDRSGSGEGRFHTVGLFSGDHTAPRAVVGFGDSLTVRTQFELRQPIADARVAITVLTTEGTAIYNLQSRPDTASGASGHGTFRCAVTLPRVDLLPGDYVLDLSLGDRHGTRLDFLKRAIAFKVIPNPTALSAPALQRRDALVFAPSKWTWEKC